MHTRKIGVGAILTLLLLSLVATASLAVNDLPMFELDRNAVDEASPGDDWDTLYGGGGSAEAFTGILPDIGADGGTQFQGGGSKDDLDITSWLWKDGEPLDKDDITNAYAAAYVNTYDDGSNHIGDLIIYFGLDRFSANGSAQVGFWFLQDPNFGLTNIPSQGGFKFSGAHTDNDVLVQSNFSQGGVIDTVTVYKWQAGALVKVADAGDCLESATADDPACALVNRMPEFAPWPYTPKANEGSPGTFLTGGFFEGGINISRLVPEAGCFTGFLAETRTSTPFDARLKDFVTGGFDLCSLAVTKTGDTLSKVGDDVDYTITIENTGALTLFKDDIKDSLLGDITIDGVDQANAYVSANTCGASLAPGATCTISLTRTVQAGDPDPLPNTVDVVYRGKSDLSGSAVSGSDDHSVNLFQPAIDVTKSGDDLSKIGDAVDYTITVYNNSSDDTPEMAFDITDAMLGIDEQDVVIANGDSYVINSSGFVIPDDASDPFVNTVNVHATVAGFPNTYDDSAMWSTNLFQPSITFDKTGSQYSKLGDDVSYVFTLNNTSSDDTPNLECTITDAMLGLNKSVTLAPGESDVTNATHTVVAGDPDPLDNTASVSCSPAGFPNVLEASDGHSVDLIHPSFTVAKTCDAEPISYLGPANFTVDIANTGDVPLDITADDGIGMFQLAPGASQSFPVSVPGPFTPGGIVENTVTASWTLPEMYGLSNTDSKSASDSCDVQQIVYETAYALGDDAVCFTDLGANNWGWVNGNGSTSIEPGIYEWPLWAGAAQCDTSNGTLVGTVTVNYDGTDVFVTFNVDPPYILGDTHVYAGYDQIPPSGFSPGQYQIYSPFDGSAIYIIVHANVGIPQ